MSSFDLVISSSHAVAKGVRVRENALHICYCHTPMRYIWDQYDQYFGPGRTGILTRVAMKAVLPALRRWDIHSSTGVTRFIANSRNVQGRIKRIYDRSADIIHPPVDVDRFTVSTANDGYFLIVAALVPYKRVDLAIEAFNTLGRRLIVVGAGSEEKKLRNLAGSNIEFTGWVDDTTLSEYYEHCHALVFPGEEDFGIVPLEAMACGKPVVAFAQGGALETVIDNESSGTGILFHRQTTEDLIAAIQKLEHRMFDPERLRSKARQFGRSVFKERMREYVEEAWSELTR